MHSHREMAVMFSSHQTSVESSYFLECIQTSNPLRVRILFHIMNTLHYECNTVITVLDFQNVNVIKGTRSSKYSRTKHADYLDL